MPAGDDEALNVRAWMPLFITAHRARISTMDHMEHSALVLLNMLMWERGGIIPNADEWLRKQLRVTNRCWNSRKHTILEHCIITADKITDPVIVAEHTKALRNREQKRAAGIASARSKAAQRATEDEQNFNERTNGSSTAGQPRAGKGKGSLPREELSVRERQGLKLVHDASDGENGK